MNIQGKAKDSSTYDAIVIGSGISGGWAAKELSEQGVKTLVLERGRAVKHKVDYPTAMYNPWDMELRGALSRELKEANPIADRCYAFGEATKHFFVKDNEHPYIQENPLQVTLRTGILSLAGVPTLPNQTRFTFNRGGGSA